MMDESNIDEFEQFLRNQADKNRMYPDDQVWRNINRQLHGEQRWPALTFAAILTGAILTAAIIFLHPTKELFKVAAVPGTTGNLSSVSATPSQKPVGNRPVTAIIKPVDEKEAIYSFNYKSAQPNTATEVAAKTGSAISTPAVNLEPASIQHISSTEALAENKRMLAGKLNDRNAVISSPMLQSGGITKEDIGVQATEKENEILAAPSEASARDDVSGASEAEQKNSLNNENNRKLSHTGNERSTRKHLAFQFYAGSSISYRALSEPGFADYHFQVNSALAANPASNVNNFVSQQSSVGFEIGAALLYALNDRIRIKTGLQFNYRQYNIDAHASFQQPSLLLLNNNTGNRDSVVVVSGIGNNMGYRPLSLHNRYFQIALPVGADWTIAESRKASVSLGATLQPTYQLNTNIYMITSDYKSYTRQPDMIRRWNLNGSIEAMATIKAAGLSWQVGPQLRYQMLPTQLNSYSVHEHLIDYGIKFGVIKNIK